MPSVPFRSDFRTPTPDDSTSEDEQPIKGKRPLITENPFIHEIDDLLKRKDYVDFRPNPFNISKLHRKRKTSSQEGGTKKKAGSIRPADTDPDQPEEKEVKQGKVNDNDNETTYRDGNWDVSKPRPVWKNACRGGGKSTWKKKTSGWTNVRGEAIPVSKPPKNWVPTKPPSPPPPKRSLLSDLDRVMVTSPVQQDEKGKKGTGAGKKKTKSVKEKEKDKPVFRKIREFSSAVDWSYG